MSSLSLPFSFLCSVFNVLFIPGWDSVPLPTTPPAYGSEVIFTGMNPPKMGSVRFYRPFPLVEMNRIELSTPCLQGRCSPS